jgi:ATP phosphoribosyltransferase regulatory subunit
MRISAALPVGVSALLFEAARQRRELENSLAAGLLAAGYGEVILPILDYLDPYEPLLGPRGRGELYRFTDRDGEMLVLRADSTPMLARLLAPRLHGLALPLRLFYRGDVVRYEEERPGRAREYYELGAELLGAPGGEADLEMVSVCIDLLLRDRALPSLSVVLGFAGALDAVLLSRPPEQGAALVQAIGRRERERVRQEAPVLLPVLEHGRPLHADDIGAVAAARLATLEEQVVALRARFPTVGFAIDLAEFASQTRDPRLADLPGQSRPYYDGLVFQAYAGDAALPVASGGRYDDLFRRLGAAVAAVGFSIGIDRLLQLRPVGPP